MLRTTRNDESWTDLISGLPRGVVAIARDDGKRTDLVSGLPRDGFAIARNDGVGRFQVERLLRPTSWDSQ